MEKQEHRGRKSHDDYDRVKLKVIGLRIKKTIKKRNKTSVAVAELCGFKKESMSQYQKGSHEIPEDKLVLLSKELNCDIEYLSAYDLPSITRKVFEILSTFQVTKVDSIEDLANSICKKISFPEDEMIMILESNLFKNYVEMYLPNTYESLEDNKTKERGAQLLKFENDLNTFLSDYPVWVIEDESFQVNNAYKSFMSNSIRELIRFYVDEIDWKTFAGRVKKQKGLFPVNQKMNYFSTGNGLVVTKEE